MGKLLQPEKPRVGVKLVPVSLQSHPSRITRERLLFIGLDLTMGRPSGTL